MTTGPRPDSEAIRELAYHLWEADGRRHGSAEDYWLQAERQLASGIAPTRAATARAVDDSIKQSFPASDPPASRIPDVPPVNAEAKWEAAAKAKGKTAPRRSPARGTVEPKRSPH
jgi:hypothetical protein